MKKLNYVLLINLLALFLLDALKHEVKHFPHEEIDEISFEQCF